MTTLELAERIIDTIRVGEISTTLQEDLIAIIDEAMDDERKALLEST